MLGNLIGGFIVVLIGTNLIPAIGDSVMTAQRGDNITTVNGSVTGTSSTLLDLTVLFFAIGIMTSGVALAVGGLRNAGMI